FKAQDPGQPVRTSLDWTCEADAEFLEVQRLIGWLPLEDLRDRAREQAEDQAAPEGPREQAAVHPQKWDAPDCRERLQLIWIAPAPVEDGEGQLAKGLGRERVGYAGEANNVLAQSRQQFP